MEIKMEIYREGLQSYLQNKVLDNDYFCDVEYQVILRNNVESFVNMNLRQEDGCRTVFYNITGKQSLDQVKKKDMFSEKECREILKDIIQVLKDVEEYMLDISHVCFSSEYIFQDINGKYYFIYDPNETFDSSKDIVGLFSWILEHINYEDRKAVELIYHIFYAVKKQDVTRQLLESCLQYQVRKDVSYETYFENYSGNSANSDSVGQKEEGGFQKQKSSLYSYDTGGYQYNMYREPSEDESEDVKANPVFLALQILFILIAIGIFVGIGYLIFTGLQLNMLPFYGKYAAGLAILAVLAIYGSYQMHLLYKKPADNQLTFQNERNKNNLNGNGNGETSSGLKESVAEDIGRTTLLSEEMLYENSDETTLLFSSMPKEQVALRCIESGEVHMIRSFPSLVGSDSSQCQITIQDHTVSRRHALLTHNPVKAEYYIEDMNSSNGTCIDHVPVQRGKTVMIEPGQVISFSRQDYQFIVL